MRTLRNIWVNAWIDLRDGWAERKGVEKIPVLWLLPLSIGKAIWWSLRDAWVILVFRVMLLLGRKVVPVLDPDRARPYGQELANAVADRLERDAGKSKDGYAGMAIQHRDYCGHGLFVEQGSFFVAETYDGWARIGDAMLRFDNRAEFTAWLAAQSDHSVDALTGEPPFQDLGGNNQQLSRARLEEFVAGVDNSVG